MSEKKNWNVNNAGFYKGDHYDEGETFKAYPHEVKYDIAPYSTNLTEIEDKPANRKTKKAEQIEKSNSEA